MELDCVSCGDPLKMHCGSDMCNWLMCTFCQLIIGYNGAIPTWERYVAEGRNDAR